MISKNILIYDCELVTFDFINDGYGSKENKVITPINNIYFTTIDSYTDNQTSYNPTSVSSKLFYDNKLSIPTGIKFNYNDIIIFNEREYKILNIHEAHKNSHIELDLQLIKLGE